jgi:hypothetical protein
MNTPLPEYPLLAKCTRFRPVRWEICRFGNRGKALNVLWAGLSKGWDAGRGYGLYLEVGSTSRALFASSHLPVLLHTPRMFLTNDHCGRL